MYHHSFKKNLQLPFNSSALIQGWRCSTRKYSYGNSFIESSLKNRIETEKAKYRLPYPSYFSSAQNVGKSIENLFDWAALHKEKQVWEQDSNIVADIRSDHAGETGAVWIYKGALAVLDLKGGSQEARAFVCEHMKTESTHLEMMEKLLDHKQKSLLIPFWKLAGFTLGALPTIISEKALFCTVEAVETFVEIHYLDHIIPLEQDGRYPELCRMLKHCCEEEVHHRDDAASRWNTCSDNSIRPWYANLWFQTVIRGSQMAVKVCKRI
mmetsp:Transcript_23633/g.29593  ORF Transcript_23633/g.29593 Transcript_23633/m.29593 type:complete len:267 (+) Transcript_23633:197-997(+)